MKIISEILREALREIPIPRLGEVDLSKISGSFTNSVKGNERII